MWYLRLNVEFLGDLWKRLGLSVTAPQNRGKIKGCHLVHTMMWMIPPPVLLATLPDSLSWRHHLFTSTCLLLPPPPGLLATLPDSLSWRHHLFTSTWFPSPRASYHLTWLLELETSSFHLHMVPLPSGFLPPYLTPWAGDIIFSPPHGSPPLGLLTTLPDSLSWRHHLFTSTWFPPPLLGFLPPYQTPWAGDIIVSPPHGFPPPWLLATLPDSLSWRHLFTFTWLSPPPPGLLATLPDSFSWRHHLFTSTWFPPPPGLLTTLPDSLSWRHHLFTSTWLLGTKAVIGTCGRTKTKPLSYQLS